ncbi:MAG: hypothetical protein ACJAUP_000823 [Cellvibrionaceae bacterium]|jgi:hypothetical protein
MAGLNKDGDNSVNRALTNVSGNVNYLLTPF